MTKPSNYIINTDYATLKNDDRSTMTINIPASFTIPANTAYVIASQTITLGTKNAPIRALMGTSATSILVPTSSIIFEVTATVQGKSFILYCEAYLRRVSATQIQLLAVTPILENIGATVSESAQTITAKVSTFLSPFDN